MKDSVNLTDYSINLDKYKIKELNDSLEYKLSSIRNFPQQIDTPKNTTNLISLGIENKENNIQLEDIALKVNINSNNNEDATTFEGKQIVKNEMDEFCEGYNK